MGLLTLERSRDRRDNVRARATFLPDADYARGI